MISQNAVHFNTHDSKYCGIVGYEPPPHPYPYLSKLNSAQLSKSSMFAYDMSAGTNGNCFHAVGTDILENYHS